MCFYAGDSYVRHRSTIPSKKAPILQGLQIPKCSAEHEGPGGLRGTGVLSDSLTH